MDKKYNKVKAKIGILGGAFNPPHQGHLVLAKKVYQKFNLEKLIFMPCGLPALKKTGLAKANDRMAMVKILIGKNPVFEISNYEIKKEEKGQKSYTRETIIYLKKKYPDKKIYWLLGEDSFREMIEGKWKYNGLKMLKETQFIIASRPDHVFGLKTLAKKFKGRAKKFLEKIIWLDFHFPVSATQIRQEIKTGKKKNKFLPFKIFNYIKKNKLYQ